MQHRKYLVKNKKLLFGLRCIDRVYQVLRKHQAVCPPIHCKKLLIAHLAHHGDVLIATSFLKAIKEYYPEMKVGFLIGSWSMDIVDQHSLIDEVHCFDHWKSNRQSGSCLKKIWRHFRTKRRALKEVKTHKYDAAIDLNPYFPNAAHFLYKARVPYRMGYETAGFGALFTDQIRWNDSRGHITSYYQHIIEKFTGKPCNQKLYPYLEVPLKNPIVHAEYICIHMGTGYRLKEWDDKKWKELSDRLHEMGHHLVLTGQGSRESHRAQKISQGLFNITNLCERSSWCDFVNVIRNAKALISVDSVSVHIGIAYKIPTVVISSGLDRPEYWIPNEEFIHHVSIRPRCFPCLNSKGCASMECIQKVSVTQVLEKLKKVL